MKFAKVIVLVSQNTLWTDIQLFLILILILIFFKVLIKTVHDYKNVCISTLKNIKNEIRYLSIKKNITEEQQQKIKLLYEEKLDIMKKLFALSSTYNFIDIMFQQ